MKSTLIALALVALVAGCKQQQSAVQGPVSQQAQPASATNLSPEDLGTLGAQIKKDPSRAHELLSSRGLDDQSFEKAIRKISQDPVASRRYAAAFKQAS